MDDLVLLKTFYSKYDAEVAVGLLKDSRIESILQADDVGGYRPHVTLSMGNNRVLVRREDAGRAVEVLKTLEENLSDDEIKQLDEIALHQPAAPQISLLKEKKDVGLMIPLVVIGLFVVIYVLNNSHNKNNTGWYAGHIKCSPARSKAADNRVCREYYRHDKVRAVWRYEDNLLEGTAKVFHPNGQLKLEEVFFSGKQQGPFKSYFESGSLQQDGRYVYGLLEGLVTTYYETGEIMRVASYQSGELHGDMKFYDRTGRPMAQEIYQKGVRHTPEGEPYQGRCQIYSVDGDLWEDANFKNGRLSGVRKKYYEDGHLEFEERYRKGKRHGEVKTYYKNGTLKGLYQYRKGELISSQEYDQDGRVVYP